MPKSKVELPSVDQSFNSTATEPMKQVEQTNTISPEPAGEGYSDQLMCYRAVDVRLKQAFHRRAFCDQMRKLIDEGATLRDGSPVSSKADVFKWFLENCV